jgi:hypothetical protein
MVVNISQYKLCQEKPKNDKLALPVDSAKKGSL